MLEGEKDNLYFSRPTEKDFSAEHTLSDQAQGVGHKAKGLSPWAVSLTP